MRLLTLATTLLPFLTSALPTSISDSTTSSTQPLPLIIWHGLGDRYDADGIASVGNLAQKIHPNTTVYPIRLDPSGSADSRATFFANVTASIDDVCTLLSTNTTFAANHTRIDALGFSQGGQFLRGLVQRCPGISVRSLVTFGSQHNGIAEFQVCEPLDFVCRGAMAAIKGNVWTEWVQGNVVPAQYYREVNATTGEASESYLEGSGWLADVNNERRAKKGVYAERLAELERFAMYVFEEDKTVIPKESGWFAEVNATSGHVTELRDRRIYKEDWLGLRKLDEKGGLVFRNASGKHMDLTDKILKEAFTDFFGPERNVWRSVKQGVEEVLFPEL